MSTIITNNDIWAIIIKALITLLIGAATTWIGTLIANAVSKNKDSKIYKYAETLVEAAEQRFPNEGTKMGPQKLDYVMSQLVIRFPKIKNNQYLYNIVEQAVFKLNDKRNQDIDAQEFYNKYGEWPENYIPSDNNDSIINDAKDELVLEDDSNNINTNTDVQEITTPINNSLQKSKKKKLSSF